MEREIRASGFLMPAAYGVTTTAEEILGHFRNSPFLRSAGLSGVAAQLRFHDGRLDFAGVEVNSYFASVAADFLRQQLLARRISFTLETVMSSPDKVRLLEQAQELLGSGQPQGGQAILELLGQVFSSHACEPQHGLALQQGVGVRP